MSQPKQGKAQLTYYDPDQEPAAAVDVDEADTPQAHADALSINEPLTSSPNRRVRRWLLISLLLLLAAVSIETTLLLLESFQQHWLLGALWASGLGIALLSLGYFIGREWLLLRRLKRRWQRQQHTAPPQLLADLKHPDLHALWQQIEQPYWNDDERQERFEKDILSRVDQQAQRIISKRAAESAALVAVSPSSIADMLLLLWRNQRMIADVARCYGVELGYWSRVRLWRQILANLAYAGISELVVDVGTQWLSAELMSKLSARAGQGLGAGLLTARLGFQVMSLTRPLPFHHVKRPGYGRLQKELLTQLSQLLPGIYRASTRTPNEPHKP